MENVATLELGTKIQLKDEQGVLGAVMLVERIAMGKLGALYYTAKTGNCYRLRWNRSEKRFVVTGLRKEFQVVIVVDESAAETAVEEMAGASA